MNNTRLFLLTTAIALAACSLALTADTAPSAAPTTQPSATNVPSADQVMSDLAGKIQKNPVIEPSIRPGGEKAPPTVRETKVPADAVIAGSSPKPAGVQVNLRQEGEFVLNRLARFIRHPKTNQSMLAFDSDSQLGYVAGDHVAEEPPIYLLPNQLLQNMENQASDRGDAVRFMVSGQVTTYRGANYLLLTSVKPVYDKGNLIK